MQTNLPGNQPFGSAQGLGDNKQSQGVQPKPVEPVLNPATPVKPSNTWPVAENPESKLKDTFTPSSAMQSQVQPPVAAQPLPDKSEFPPPSLPPLPPLPQQPLQAPVPPAPTFHVETQPRKKNKLLLLVLPIIIVLLLASVILGAGVLAAYGKIPIKDSELKQKITEIVFSIPFIPKTPEYVLQKSILAHKDVASAQVDASLASSSDSLANLLGSQDFDLSIKGPFDFTDAKNPKASFEIKLTNQLDLEIRAVNKDAYIKVNRVPAVVTGFLAAMGGGIKLDPLLNRWVFIEGSKLDTEAREYLEKQDQEESSAFDKAYAELVERVFKEKILPQVKMGTEKVDEFTTHKLEVELSGELLDSVFEEVEEIVRENQGTRVDVEEKAVQKKPSEVIKSLKITLWIDKSAYYLRKMSVYTQIESKALSGMGSAGSASGALTPDAFLPRIEENIELVFMLKLSQIGEPVEVEVPEEFMTTEEFMTEMFKLMGISNPVDRANDAKIQADIQILRSGCELYYADNQKYPQTAEELIEAKLIRELPEMAGGRIKLRTSTDGQNLLIYSLSKRANELYKPYYAVYVKKTVEARIVGSGIQSYSASDLTVLLIEMGIGEDAELTAILNTPLEPAEPATPSALPMATPSASPFGGMM